MSHDDEFFQTFRFRLLLLSLLHFIADIEFFMDLESGKLIQYSEYLNLWPGYVTKI